MAAGRAGASEGGDAGWLDLLRLLPHGGRRAVAGLVAVVAVEAALPLVVIVATGRLVTRVTAGPAAGSVAGPLVVLSLLLVARRFADPLRDVCGFLTASRIDGHLRVRAMRAATAPLGTAFLEDPATLDAVEAAAASPGPFRPATPGGAAVGVVGLLGRYAQGVGLIWLIARFSLPLAAVLVVGALLFRRPHRRENVALARAFDAHLPGYRRARYLSGLLVEPPAAKEIRVYGLGGWLQERHRRSWREVTGAMSELRRRTYRRLSAYHLLLAPLHAVAFLVVGRAALDGRIDPGTAAVVIQATLGLFALAAVGPDESQIEFGSAALPALAALEDRAAHRGPAPAGGRPARGLPADGIRFEGVRFAYPDGRVVFEGLDLSVEAGTSLAVVGANGVGKSTLLKLLARLYEPDGGRILVDGIDLREIDPVSWRAQLAVVFQDFARYQLPAADNVGFGRLDRAADRGALDRAAARAGTLGLIEGLAGGWTTVLARGFSGGVDLSGGEWQRIALARALLAVDAGASVLVLDEPTANLDVRAEAELFEHLLELVAAGEAAGDRRLTTLLVSHRFSTVRRADRICVLDRCGVVEQGTHAELLAAGGRYAGMFSLQAGWFGG